jgi:integrase
VRDYLTEAEFLVLLQGTRGSRYRWRNTAMLLLTFYHGLRVSELRNRKYKDLDLSHGRLWIARLKANLSTEQPLLTEELRALKPYLPQRGDQFTRFAINYLSHRSLDGSPAPSRDAAAPEPGAAAPHARDRAALRGLRTDALPQLLVDEDALD